LRCRIRASRDGVIENLSLTETLVCQRRTGKSDEGRPPTVLPIQVEHWLRPT